MKNNIQIQINSEIKDQNISFANICKRCEKATETKPIFHTLWNVFEI